MLQRYRGQTRPQQNLGAAGRQFVSIPARMVIPHVAPSAFPFFKMGPSDKMDASDQIFNRTLEFTILERRVLRKPGAMTVVLGPSDCGKSALLNAFLDKTQRERRVFRLDLRMFDSACPDSFTNMLWNSFDNATDLSRYVEISKWTAGGQYAPSFPLGILQAGILNWLKRSKQAQPAPILFIDFAERMMSWRNHGYLQGFLDFLVLISKQENLAHVILASSEHPFIGFLQAHRVDDDRFELFAMGNLPEEDAKVYLLGGGKSGWPGYFKAECSTAVSLGFDCPQQIWETVHRLCGGNILTMKNLVGRAADAFAGQCYLDSESDLHAKITASWEIAFKIERARAQEVIAQGSTPASWSARGRDSPAWSPEQWQTVQDALAEAGPHHVVRVSEMERKLGKGDLQAGSIALASLLKFHMVECRWPSILAQDIPYHAYGGEPVITAPSAAVLDLLLGRRQAAANT